MLLILAKELSSKNLADINLKKVVGADSQRRFDDISMYRHTINQMMKVLRQ